MKRVNNLLKIIVVVIGLTIPFAVYGQSSSKLYQKGETLMQSGKYYDAINAFNAAMAMDSGLEVSCKAKIKQCNEKIYQKTKAKKAVSADLSTSGRDELTIDTEHAELGWETTPLQVKVASKKKDWEVSSNESWCIVKKSSNGDIVYITCNQNDSVLERVAIVTISNRDSEKKIEIKQGGQQPFIKLEKESVVFPKDGGEEKIGVYSNTEWEVIEKPDWCTFVSYGNDFIILKVDEYKNERQGILTIMTKVGRETSSTIISQKKIKTKSFWSIKR